MDPDIPLVVPEVNGQLVSLKPGIIANPNCSTIQMVVVLKPLHDRYRIRRVVVATYQSVTGAGQRGVEQLKDEIGNEGRKGVGKFPHPIAYNLIPQIDEFLEDGSTKEEQKMVRETTKIMDDPSIRVSATCVRVPVTGGHSESVTIEFERPVDVSEARDILQSAPGVVVVDDPSNRKYPMPIHSDGRDEVFVGRIRRDPSVEHGLNLWIVADNLRKGAATNAVQIAELAVRNKP
jgi:aspartate-semialdehyde dehydrogenase